MIVLQCPIARHFGHLRGQFTDPFAPGKALLGTFDPFHQNRSALGPINSWGKSYDPTFDSTGVAHVLGYARSRTFAIAFVGV